MLRKSPCPYIGIFTMQAVNYEFKKLGNNALFHSYVDNYICIES
jgi:hypothetical protein